jgi:sensor histidine kinase regulating citrate/malate metabolism
MKFLQKRSVRLKWRLLGIILPVALIPIAVIIWFINGRVSQYLRDDTSFSYYRTQVGDT